jgi:Tfp pilus assembly protein PilX
MNTKCNIRNESGAVLVGSLLMLGFLTFLGVAATTTSILEQQIAGNNKAYTECFYVAEATALEAAQKLENAEVEELHDKSKAWLFAESDIEDGLEYLEDPSNWDFDGENDNDNAVTSDLATADAQLAFDNPVHTAVDRGVASGSSLSMTESTVHAFSTFGMCDTENSLLVEIGYRRRY